MDILTRKPIYFVSTYFLNSLLRNENKKFIKKFLLSKKIISNYKFKKDFKNQKFITFSVRLYPHPYSQIRNIDTKNLIKTIKFLKRKFPEHEILIISDHNGCKEIDKINKKKKLNLKFSKKYSNSFVKDGNLILNSDFNVQYNGGGVSEFALFSDVPYLHYTFFYDFGINLFPLNLKKYSWQSKDQYKYFSFSDKIYYKILKNL
tara:strand:- start:57 stop:668 length:612 start_codon:yes stop_codon:yes gene_type:complete